MSLTRSRRTLATTAIAGVAASLAAVIPVSSAAAADPDLAQLGTVSASMSQDDTDGRFPAENAIDGDPATRWASGNGPDDADAVFAVDLTSDLGKVATISQVDLAWEAAYAVSYDVEVATVDPHQETSWTTVSSETAGDGGEDAIVLETPVQARYVRLSMTERVAFTWDAPTLHYYGYSLYTLAVRGTFATPLVGLGAPRAVPAGQTATVPVRLSNPAEGEQTVRVTSGGGTAEPDTDYAPVDEVITFPAGETEQSVQVTTLSRGPLAPRRTVDLTLSEPSAGIELGARTTTTLTLTPTGDLREANDAHVLHDFSDGVPAGFFGWGAREQVTPQLSTTTDDGVPGAASDNQVLVADVEGSPTAEDWFGFSNDTPADWSDYDGFQFYYLGTGSGDQLRFELKSGGQMFEETRLDDSAGWRLVKVLFADLRLKGDPDADARFTPEAAGGFAVTLTGRDQGEYLFDDFAVYKRTVLLDDYETPVHISDDAPIGYFTWSDSDASVITIGQEPQERGDVPDNDVLAGTYKIKSGGWGGFSNNLAGSQDWSGFRGIRFWWYASQTDNPASPTAGADIAVEVKDGGPDGEHSELWRATFKDRWGSATSRWKLVELPFSDFALSDHQPGDEETRNGTLDLTSAWGAALTFEAGTAEPVRWAIDDLGLYGTRSDAPTVAVGTTQDVYLVDAGDVATVEVELTTTDGEPTSGPVEVDWATGAGTAVAGTDYEAGSGTLTFPAGTASGDTQPVEVSTLAHDGASEALSVPLELVADGVATPEEAPRVVLNAHGLPYLDSALPTEDRVADLVGRMSLREKAGQMAQAERLGLSSPGQVADLGLGSILSGGGSTPAGNTPAAWARMIDDFQRQALSTRWQVPLVYGADAVHGHSNLTDATIFPHNIGLGAARDPQLSHDIARATAAETRTTGVTWAFAPCLCVGRDERWGRTYEVFGEDPALVTAYAGPTVRGLQGDDPSDITGADEVLASAKHWVGDGGTTYDASKAGNGYPIDQGVTDVASMEELERLHVAPYEPAIEAGVGTMMPSYSGVSIDGGPVLRMTEHSYLNNEVLKGELGFDGFLISDWEAIDKLPGSSYPAKVVRAVNAGIDMGMAPFNFSAFIDAVVTGVEGGDIDAARVDDAVSRILTEKMDLGLFEAPFTDDSMRDEFGGEEHRDLARQAAADSQVLLSNDGALPLADTGSLYVAGSNADDLGHQMGGWTISWQGGSGDTTTGTTVLEGLRAGAPDLDVTYSRDASEPTDGYDAGLVVVGESPYAEGLGDVGNNGRSLSLTAADQAAIDTVCSAMECTVLVISGRPQLIDGPAATADAVVAGFLPGSQGEGVADVLLGRTPFTGQLPLTWPASADQVPINVGDASYDPAYAYGWGLRTDEPRERLTALAGSLDGAAAEAAQELLDAPVWAEDGSIADLDTAWPLLGDLLALLTGTDEDVLPLATEAVSLARDAAQDAMVAGSAPETAAAMLADAEHAAWSGDPATATQLLGAIAGVEDTGQELEVTDDPRIVGVPEAGQVLRATRATWSVEEVESSWQWLRDGEEVPGATGRRYRLGAADVGTRIAVRETATAGDQTASADSRSTRRVRKDRPRVLIERPASGSTGKSRFALEVRVATPATDRPVGRLLVRYDGKELQRQLRGRDEGVRVLTLPRRGSGKKHVRVVYEPRGSSAEVLARGSRGGWRW